MPKTTHSEAKRVGRFSLVGVANTIIDFGVYNLLTTLGLSLIVSTYISGTTAMVFSFFLNRGFVFKNHKKAKGSQAIIFFMVTAFSVWAIQPAVIHFLTINYQAPLNLGIKLAGAIHVTKFLSESFLRKNGAKAAGVVIGLVWNYLTYKHWVFKK